MVYGILRYLCCLYCYLFCLLDGLLCWLDVCFILFGFACRFFDWNLLLQLFPLIVLEFSSLGLDFVILY